MPAIDFEDFPYYPALRTRPAEMLGYQKLSATIKDKLLPLFTVGQWPRQDNLSVSMQNAMSAADGRPFMLDLTNEKAYETGDLKSLKDPTGNFKNWQDFATRAEHNTIIPVVQMPAGSKIPQIIKQARAFESHGLGKVAFRITDFAIDPEKVVAALSALDDPENGLVIIDVGYIRETMAASIAACVLAINEIRNDVEEAIISVISTSFPSAIPPFLDANSAGKRGIIPMMERALHQAIGTDAVIYGDHGSIHSKVYPATGGKYTPRVDFPLYDAWVFERRPGENSDGFISAAAALITSYPEIGEDDSWGANAIKEAATGKIDGMKTHAAWIAARVNMHITKQFEISSQSQPDSEDGDLDGLI